MFSNTGFFAGKILSEGEFKIVELEYLCSIEILMKKIGKHG